MPKATFTIGVISDTHGLLRPQALEQLAGSDHILHAGDICEAQVLRELERIAPVSAVRGNNDKGAWADVLPHSELLTLAGCALYMVHDIADLGIDPAVANVAVVISGHSHKPSSVERDGVLYLNPGSAGPRRFTLPISLARLRITAGRPVAELISLTA